MNVFLSGLTVLVAILAAAGLGHAKENQPLIEEFLIAEEVYAQEAREVQLTAGLDAQHGKDQDDVQVPFLLEYGLTDRLQIDAEIPYRHLDLKPGGSASGAGDAGLGLLYAIHPDFEPMAVSLWLKYHLPTGDEDKGLGDGTYKAEPAVIVARNVAAGEVHLGAEAALGGGADFTYVAAGVYPWWNCRFTLELEATDAESHVWRLAPGFYVKPTDSWEFGLGVPVGLTADSPDSSLVLKLTGKFKV